MLEENLKKLAEDLNLPPFPSKDRSSTYVLELAENLSFSIRDLKVGFDLFGNIAPAPSQKKEDAYIYFMKANLLGQGTGDQAIGLDSEEKFLTLSCRIPYDVNYKEFKEKIEDFANYLNYWQVEVKKMQESAEGSIL